MTKVTGGSDDLIILTGDLFEDFSHLPDSYTIYDNDTAYLSFSDGTVLSVKFEENGIWRFNMVCQGHLFEKKVEGSVELDTFDEIHFKDGLKWCLYGERFYIKKDKKNILQKYLVASKSSNKSYTVSRLEDDEWQCNCPAWIFKKQGQERKQCHHIQAAKDFVEKKTPQLKVEIKQ